MAIATVIKPMSVFFTVAAVVSLGIARLGWKAAVMNRELHTVLVLGLLPAVLYYGHGVLIGPLARDQLRMRFVPPLLVSQFFWHGWLTQIRRVFGLPLLALGMAGAALAPPGVPRALLTGLCVGYGVFAVAFTYHMPTHDYYHLPFIPATALGVAAIMG